jgi:hypothetical protein
MQYLTTTRLALMLGASALLAACAARHPVAQADWEHGAREGRIVRDYAEFANRDSPPLPVCLAQLGPEAWRAHHFVQVRYQQARHVHFEVADLPPGLRAGIGAGVEIWPADCAAGQIGRIAQVFSPGRD